MTSGKEVMSTRRASRAAISRPSADVAPWSEKSTPIEQRWSRRRGVLGVFASFAAVGFVVAYVGPTGAAIADANAVETAPISLYADSLDDVQTRPVDPTAVSDEPVVFARGGYTVYVKPPPPPPPPPKPVAVPSAPTANSSGSGWRPPFVTPDPGTAQSIAYDMVRARGWGDDQFACLVALWNKESGWRVNAYNSSSGAYGIPQSLPGNKMATAGADWETNPATQITWGLGYIGARYGTPCGAWDHSGRVGWY